MAKRPLPTGAELEILRVLWERGPCTVRDVHETVSEPRGTGYTTVLKLLQLMTGKGLVRRDETSRAHVYQASRPAEQTQRQLVREFIKRAFGGSTEKLVLQALAAKRASASELAQIRQLLDELERGAK